MGEISYLLHFWDILRDREYLTRWNLIPGSQECILFGGMSSYLEQGFTIVLMGVSDENMVLNKGNLPKNTNYRNFLNFKSHLEDKLRVLTT